MTLAILLAALALVIIVAAGASSWAGRGIRANLLCLAGVLLCAAGAGHGWEYRQGDVGWVTGWVWMILAGAFISIITPLGGLIGIGALLGDFNSGYSSGAVIEGAGYLALAIVGTGLVIVSSMVPLGFGVGPRSAGTVGRLLTLNLFRNPADMPR